jgi:flavin reductase (DIM6/NTAB) family NADH-FMN oxidoreductase RutF
VRRGAASIALVTTLAASGTVNAAPFSSFVALSPRPPLVGFVCGGWEGRRKDTLANVERSGEFVVNVVAEAMAAAVQRCADPLSAEESEIAVSKLATAPSTRIGVPRLADVPISLECRLETIVDLGDAPDRLIVGRIVYVHLADGVRRNSRIDPQSWRPLGRVGGGAFCGLSAPFRIDDRL